MHPAQPDTQVKQHYVPGFYLNGFASPVKKSKKKRIIHAYMLPEGIWEDTRARDLGYEVDFYARTGGEGDEAEQFEAFFGKIETLAEPVFQKIAARVALTPEDRETLMAFAVVLHSRVPVQIDWLESHMAQIQRMFAQQRYSHWLKHPESFEADKIRWVKAGIAGAAILTLEQMNPDRYEITMKDTAWSTSLLLSARMEFVPVLARMEWLILASAGSDYFVTSDHPYNMTAPGPFPAGLARKDVQVTLPLKRDLGLVVLWPEDGVEVGPITYEEADRARVAAFNYRAIVTAKRFIAAPARTFPGDEHLPKPTKS